MYKLVYGLIHLFVLNHVGIGSLDSIQQNQSNCLPESHLNYQDSIQFGQSW